MPMAHLKKPDRFAYTMGQTISLPGLACPKKIPLLPHITAPIPKLGFSLEKSGSSQVKLEWQPQNTWQYAHGAGLRQQGKKFGNMLPDFEHTAKKNIWQ
jgi:hypothetical protein